MTPPRSTLADIPRGIWVLGVVSLLMDTSSEMVHALLPVYMATVLGASALAIGALEGAAEATALIVKVFSGVLSDWTGRRKGLALLGYGLGAATKPVFALAGSVGWVVAARLTDRVGKGIRGAPRDAMVADLAPAHLRGAAFGLRQSLDTVGAFAGPLVAIGLMLLWTNDVRAVFWVAVIPAFLAVALLAVGVREPDVPVGAPRTNPVRRDLVARLGPAFWRVTLLGAALALARFSEAFLILRAQGSGLATALVPLVLVVMNVAYAATAYPAGRLADRLAPDRLLALGLVVLIGADLVLAMAPGWPAVLAGVALWGLHLGLTQGVMAGLVAASAPPDLRGTAFGVFNLAGGGATLLASLVAGAAWDGFGPAATFATGAVLAGVALALLALRPPGVSMTLSRVAS